MSVMSISIANWIIKDIVGKSNNRSGRIEELIIKGHMYEMNQERKNLKTDNGSDPVHHSPAVYNPMNSYIDGFILKPFNIIFSINKVEVNSC